MTASVAGLGTGLRTCEQPLVTAYDAALLDLDGVLYLGEQGVPHAAEAVTAARVAGVRVAFVTNNASREPARVAAHLTELGIAAEPADVVTSGQAAARLVAEAVPPGSAVLVVGTAALVEEVAAAGLRPVRTVAEAGAGGPTAVVQGLSPDACWRDLSEAVLAVRGGALWIAGNVDSTLPSPRGPLPGNGTLVDVVRTVTGLAPVVAGKPEPALHEESVRRTGSSRPLVVGDRLDTDVRAAVRAGADSLLVLTGVVDLAALLAAREGWRPSFVAPDLRGLHLPQPPVTVTEAAASCGAWQAWVDDGVLRLRRAAGDAVREDAGDDHAGADPADAVAALRAACAVAWASSDEAGEVRDVAWPSRAR